MTEVQKLLTKPLILDVMKNERTEIKEDFGMFTLTRLESNERKSQPNKSHQNKRKIKRPKKNSDLLIQDKKAPINAINRSTSSFESIRDLYRPERVTEIFETIPIDSGEF